MYEFEVGKFEFERNCCMVAGHSICFPFDIYDVFGMYCWDKEMVWLVSFFHCWVNPCVIGFGLVEG